MRAVHGLRELSTEALNGFEQRGQLACCGFGVRAHRQHQQR
jgi:hypothetical protein